MLGFIPVTETTKGLGRIKGITDTSTTLSPMLFLTASEPVISFRIPVLDCNVVCSTVCDTVIALPDLPPLDVKTLSRPVPNVCQSLNCVPNDNPTKLCHASFSPWRFTITSGLLLVSTQLSFGGVRLTVPIHANTANGFTLIALLAICCATKIVESYGKVIQSPVFSTPVDAVPS